MRKVLPLQCSFFACLIIGLGCSSARLVSDISEVERPAVISVADHRQQSKTKTSAQLVQTTIRSSRLTKRFNLEIYHRHDTTAFYTGGFAGRGSFKGLLVGSNLQFILPREKQYYDGPASGLVKPDLSRYQYVVVRLRELLSGNLICDSSDGTSRDSCEVWDQDLFVKGGRIVKVVFRSLIDPVTIEAVLFKFKEHFPYYEIRRVRIENSDSGAKIKLQTIEQRYGPVPEVKLQLPDFSGWERIDYFELK